MALLSVACMLEDRFSDSALVFGDITAERCRKAVETASDILGREISVPVLYDKGRLWNRLEASEIGKEQLLE